MLQRPTKRRGIRLIVSAILSLAHLAWAETAPSQQITDRLRSSYLVGAHVYRAPPPEMENVFADMATMKKLGMNLVNIQEVWSWDNPREDQYDFSHLVALLKKAQELGLLASVTTTLENVPKWVWDKYPDCRILNAQNQPQIDPSQYVMPSDGKPGPCWDHAGVKREAEEFLRAIAETVKPFDNMLYWNVWQEIHLWSSVSGSVRPYNPETLDGFRSFLEQKYGPLERLNDAWKTRFGGWKEVDPPRAYFMVPSFIDWSRYIHEGYLAGTLDWRRQTLLKVDPRQRPVVAHTSSPYYGSTCEFFWSKRLDGYGTSFYPTVQTYQKWKPAGMSDDDYLRYQNLWSSLYQMNYSRCAAGNERHFFLSEMAAGQYNNSFTVRAQVSADDIRRWLLLQLASGSKGVILWNTRPEHFWGEAQGQGFLDADGGITPRAEIVGAFASAVARHRELAVFSTKPVAPVALFLDEDLFRFFEGSGATDLITDALRGSYMACFNAGADVDFVDGNRIDSQSLSAYHAVIHPFPALMSEAMSLKLARYVEGGGTLICGPVPGRFDEHGFARLHFMNATTQELFGVRHASLQQVAEFGGQRKWTPSENRPGDLVPATTLAGVDLLDGLHPKAAFYLQTFETQTARPLLLWGTKVVAARNPFGQGTAYLLGTLFSHSIMGEHCQDFQQALERLLRSAGAVPRTGSDIFVCRRTWKGRQLLFLLNRTGQEKQWKVTLGSNESAEDFLSQEPFAAGSSVPIPPFDIRCLVAQTE